MKHGRAGPRPAGDTPKRVRPCGIELPDGWSCVQTRGFGPFVTGATLERPDGYVVEWTSRGSRKRSFLPGRSRGSTWWAPGAAGWWTGVLFAIGATLFALGSAPGYRTAVGNGADSLTFFAGSLFFTSAAFLQYLETANTGRTLAGASAPHRVRIFTWEPERLDWWASVVQFAGTLFFNISTFNAMYTSLPAAQADRMVWRPDLYGATCFLIASLLAWMESEHSILSWRPRSISWWITALNLLGSFAFGVSALASYVVPRSGNAANVMLLNLGTFIGAVCFLAGAVLLLPERTIADSR